jgi:hypothetical protein
MISAAQVQQAYLAAKRAIDGEVSTSDAVRYLTSHHGLNSSTANTFVRVLGKMLTGQLFTRGLALAPTRYYLERILADNGRTGLSHALDALMQHINYYENRRSVNMNGLRDIHRTFSALQ